VLTKTDIVIAGGGLAGASLAAALRDTDIRVTVVEAFPIDSDQQPSFDERLVALTWTSRRIFHGIGVWSQIAEVDASPIQSIHVSNRGHFGMTELSVADLKGDAGAEALGYLVPNRVIGRALHDSVAASPNVEIQCPARVVDARPQSDGIVVETDQGTLEARLLIIADGGRSALARSLGMTARGRQYRQQALVSVVSCDRPHQQRAYERFTTDGPLALLPASSNRFALAWTVPPAHGAHLCELDDAAFLQQLQRTFGHRAGRFADVGARKLYPLSLNTLTSPVAERAVAIGNAAHTVHPVAGQGFNLGLRDVAQLSEMIFDTMSMGKDPGHSHLLRRYAEARRGDTQKVARLTDGLLQGFSSEFVPLALLRNSGLSLINILPPIKRRLLNETMGLGVPAGRLSLGLPLANSDAGSHTIDHNLDQS